MEGLTMIKNKTLISTFFLKLPGKRPSYRKRKSKNPIMMRLPLFWKTVAMSVAILVFAIPLSKYYRFDLALYDPYEWHIYMGEKQLVMGNTPLAVEHANKALMLDASRPGAYSILAGYYRSRGLIDDMEREVEHLKDYPEYKFEYHVYRALILQEREQFGEAIGEYQNALDVGDALFPYTYINLGVAYLRLGNYSLAASSFREGIDFMETGNSRASQEGRYLAALHAGLGFAYGDLGMDDLAKGEISQAENFFPSSIEDMRLAIMGDYFY